MDLPRMIFILVAAAVVWLAARYGYLMKKCHFECPGCRHSFKPAFARLLFSMNAGAGKVLKCPNCKGSYYMEPKKD